jgi:LacI family transcriptional regulator
MPNSVPKRVLFASPWWHSDIVNGVLRHAASLGWHVDLQTVLSGQLPGRWAGDGIITQLGGDLEQTKRLLAETACPAVSLNNNFPEIDIPRVSTDGQAVGRMAAEHFMERGFQTFAFYSARESIAASQRYGQFAKTLELAGHRAETLSWHDRRKTRDENWRDRQQWLVERLKSLDQPLAVFAFNDQAAVEVIEACLAESIAVPDQVAVLGVLDMDLFRHCTTVSLSSIQFDFDRITREACELLDRLMEGEPVPTEPILHPPTGIAVRQSTDTLAAHAPVVARAVRFMLDHYAEPIGIDDILEAAGGSRAGLFNAFKKDRDQAPGEVLLDIRLDRAKRMLEQTDEKVYTVAEACGFGKPVNLHRAFNQSVGMSPNRYRKAKQATINKP